MDWTYCFSCDYAEELSDGTYYCPYYESFERSGCSNGMRGYPRLADRYTEKLYEEYLSLYPYNAEDNHADPSSLLRLILDWISDRRNSKKEEQ